MPDVTSVPIDDLDIVFISYDEPMKDQHWFQLVEQNPFVKRVDGVVGFDAAHKEAARIAETERFITIDGDTTVHPEFFNMILRYDERQYRDHVFSWAGTNAVNGLVYGNGSIKCWPRDVALTMKTHENAPAGQEKIEFCWTVPYLSMKDSYSTTHPAPTPYHGFRAGFREGVKMALDGGNKLLPNDIFRRIWKGNAHRLLTWASVGADQPNGLWCIYGARMGLLQHMDEDFDMSSIADYNWFQSYWDELDCESLVHDNNKLMNRIDIVGSRLHKKTGVYIPLFDPEQSRFHKNLVSYSVPATERVLFPE